MNLGRLAAAALALAAFGATANAGNGSNYMHLTNGIDYFYGKAPTLGNNAGIFRCFPADMLYSPTKVVDPANTPGTVGQYASKVCAFHVTVSASAGKTLNFPIFSLSSNNGDCAFLQSGGAGGLNYALASFGPSQVAVVGPANSPTANPINLLAAVGGLTFVNPFTGPGTAFTLFFNLGQIFGSPSTIAVPEGDSLVVWLQDDPNLTGAGNMQYWTGSQDELNICSSWSFLFSGGPGLVFAFIPAFEWALGIGTLDATLSTYVSSVEGTLGIGAGGADAGIAAALAQKYDSGSGSRTISLTGQFSFGGGGSLGSNVLGFNSYDESNPFGGSNRIVMLNLWSLDVSGTPVCALGNHLNPPGTQVILPTGGPGGPPLSTLIPQQPRLTGKVDSVTTALLANGLWVNGTKHASAFGGINFPYFGAAAGLSGGTGNTGGFAFPIPPLSSLIGVELYAWSLNLNPSGTAIAKTANNGHSHTNGYPFTFHP